ncbi:MAG: histidine kinase [Herbinix sp.]|jgi:signal transduction histidine kinase|nr:histidine kinase [Herbinix sp.]
MIIKKFMKDHILDFIAYTTITAFILLYYRLEIGKPIPILYPIILVLFTASVITFMKGIRYFRVSAALESGNYHDCIMKGTSEQSLEYFSKIEDLHKHYQDELSQQLHQKEQTYAFVAQMAHDMKIPIAVIRLLLEEADHSVVSYDEQLQERIMGENNKLLDKLTQLLCYLRLGQFEKDFLIEQVDLITEVRNAINNKKEYFILNKIYPRLHVSQDEVVVLSDQKWNGMLLDQIISNAIKYSSLKGQEDYIDFHITANNQYAELTITDYGIGIPEYDLERIYEPFFTGENGRKIQNSSGIGLYLCKIISEKLGHIITITSVKDETTAVKIRYLSKM